MKKDCNLPLAAAISGTLLCCCAAAAASPQEVTLVERLSRAVRATGAKIERITRSRYDAGALFVHLSRVNRRTMRSLEGYPIEELVLSDSQVVDLGLLPGHGIKMLGLIDVTVTNLCAVTNWPLEKIVAEKAGLTDLAPLRSLSALRSLSLSMEKIRHLDPLSGLRLTSLVLVACGVEHIDALRGMPLKSIVLTGCPIRDLSPLSGMVLQEIDIDSTKVHDISVLRGMPLMRVRLDPAAITNGLDVLLGMEAEAPPVDSVVTLRRRWPQETGTNTQRRDDL